MKVELLKLILAMTINVCFIEYANSFDNKETHPNITDKSITNSNFNDYLFQLLRFSNGAKEIIGESKILFPAKKSVIEWLKSGSYEEDRPTCRASTHFHNPFLT